MKVSGLERVVSQYQAAYGRHGWSHKSVFWPKGRQQLRYEVLTQHIAPDSNSTIMDFGCGLGFGLEFLRARGFMGKYVGVDIVPEFVQACSERWPEETFLLTDGYAADLPNVDHVIASGAFGIAVNDSQAMSSKWVRDTILGLLAKARVSLASDFMRSQVDFQQADAYHEDPVGLASWVLAHASDRFILRLDYLPFEFAVVMWKRHLRSERPAEDED